jgi:hypothetical protein
MSLRRTTMFYVSCQEWAASHIPTKRYFSSHSRHDMYFLLIIVCERRENILGKIKRFRYSEDT